MKLPKIIGGNLHNFRLDKDFLHTKDNTLKKKIDRIILLENKEFWALKDTAERMKNPVTGWEKILTHQLSHKGLKSRIYEEFLSNLIRKQ